MSERLNLKREEALSQTKPALAFHISCS